VKWQDVGDWVKRNAGPGAALVGSLITGNIPGAVAAGVSIVSGATGTNSPAEALAALQTDPQTMVKLKELYYQNEEAVRKHIETMALAALQDKQEEHKQTQETIRTGDTALDEYVRRTRPRMARESWLALIAYCFVCLAFRIFDGTDLFNGAIASVIASPAWAYLGLRTFDKRAGTQHSDKVFWQK
jgi:hypothetical protein